MLGDQGVWGLWACGDAVVGLASGDVVVLSESVFAVIGVTMAALVVLVFGGSVGPGGGGGASRGGS